MRLKTIVAGSIAEGMRRARRQYGDDAVIVRTQEGEGGVLITLAVEVPDAAPPPDPAEAPAAVPAGAAVLDAVARGLDYHRVPAALADRLLAAAEASGLDEPASALAAALAARFGFSPVDAFGPTPRPLLFVGPPGAGKTVTVAKLAAEAVLADRPVALISADTERAGALEQLGRFAGTLGLALGQAADPAALLTAVVAVPAGAATLVDAPGCNPFDARELTEIAAFAEAVDAEPILVLPAGLDAAEAADIAAAFARIGAARLIVTGVDSARRLGALLAAAEAGRLALAQVGIARRIADGLCRLRPETLASLLLGGLTARSSKPARLGGDRPKQGASWN